MLNLQHAFDRLSEATERFLASWWGVTLTTALCALCGLLWGWDGIDRAIYIVGFFVVILLIGTSRRDWKAQHAQMEATLEGADLARLEERSEQEIEAARGD